MARGASPAPNEHLGDGQPSHFGDDANFARFYGGTKLKPRIASKDRESIPGMAYSNEMPPRLIAIDMDGTLLNSDGHVSARNRSALYLAENAGAEIVISTGRRHSYAMRVLRELGLHPDSALVSSNGTVIRTLGSILLHRTHMPLHTAQWLCSYLQAFRSTLVLTFDLVGPDGDDSHGALVVEHMDELHAKIGRWMQSNAAYISHVDRLEDVLQVSAEQMLPIQMMLCGHVARMQEAESQLAQHPRITPVGSIERPDAEITLHRTIYPESDLCILDILPAGCSKASALRHLAHLRGVTEDQILAIGDNWNDVPMLRMAGHPVLMSNAPEDLKAMASAEGWTIAPSNDDDGVAIAIENAFSTVAAL